MLLPVLPLALIAVLQTLLSTSQRHDGLLDISDNVNFHHAWTYVPALVLFLTAALFDSTGAAVKMLAPYKMLKHDSQRTRAALVNDFLHLPAIAILPASIQIRQWALSWSLSHRVLVHI